MLLMAATGEALADRLDIQKAELRSGGKVLVVEGTADQPGEVVLVKDAESRQLLGGAVVRNDGKWLLKIRNPGCRPAEALAVCGSASDREPVELRGN